MDSLRHCHWLALAACLAGCPFHPDATTAAGDDGSSGDGGSDGSVSASVSVSDTDSASSMTSSADGNSTSASSATSAESDTTGGDPCGDLVCVHGTCSATTDAPACTCDPGWEGPDCGQNIDDCAAAGCVNGTCVDQVEGFMCECDPGYDGDICDEVAQPFCLVGTLTVDDALDVVNGNPATGVFEHLQGVPIDMKLVLPIDNSYTMVGGGEFGPQGQLRMLDVSAVSFVFGDNQLNDEFAAYEGMPYDQMALVNGPTIGYYIGNMVSPEAAEYWGFETYTDPLGIVIGDDGFPVLLPSTGGPVEGGVILRRYVSNPFNMTDYAMSRMSVELLNGDDCN
jgi:hypothetical protein